MARRRATSSGSLRIQRFSDETLRKLIASFEGHRGDFIKTAAEWQMRPGAVEEQLKLAAQRGLMGTKPVLFGFELTKTTTVTNADRDVIREFIQQKPEHGEKFAVPDGHWIEPRHGRFVDQCCDCGLTHVINFAVIDKRTRKPVPYVQVQFKLRVDRRKMAASRRKLQFTKDEE